MQKQETIMCPEDEQRLRGFRLLDDDFMRMVFDDNIEATALLINVFLDRNDLTVKRITTQKDIKNPAGRSARLDIFAEDMQGRIYNIEIQRADHGAGERRARYNSSLLDVSQLKAGKSTDTLPESYVIFITERDVRGKGRPIYRFRRMDEETHELFNDGSHIIYVNGAYVNDDRIGRLMHDFRCVEAADMHNAVLAKKVRYFKETEGGRNEMCKVMEDMRNEAKQEGAREIALALLKRKISVDVIAECSGLTLEEVKALAETLANE